MKVPIVGDIVNCQRSDGDYVDIVHVGVLAHIDNRNKFLYVIMTDGRIDMFRFDEVVIMMCMSTIDDMMMI